MTGLSRLRFAQIGNIGKTESWRTLSAAETHDNRTVHAASGSGGGRSSAIDGVFKVGFLLVARLRPHDEIATCLLAIANLTFNLRCPFSENPRLLTDARQTWCEDQFTFHFDPGCVKTLFKSKFAAHLPDFRKLQFAKALISLKLKFWRLDFNHNLIRSLTFSHSLDPEQTFCGEKYRRAAAPRPLL